ncbi:MAG: hypothetical protein AB1652_01030 [Bacillota bacterium]
MMDFVSAEQIQEWKKEYGEVYEVRSDSEEETSLPVLYFRKPNRQDLSRLFKEIMQDIYKALNNLIFACLLYPSAEVVRKAFDDKPGLVLSVGGELQKAVGANRNFFTREL